MKLTLIAVFLLGFSFFAENAVACSCGAHPTVEKAIDNAEYVFVGTATKTLKPATKQSSMFENTITNFTVIHSFKGGLTDNVELTYDGSRSSCGIRFEKQRPHLVFAYKSGDGRLHTSMCSKDYSYTDLHYLLFLTLGWNTENPSIHLEQEWQRENKLRKLANDPWDMRSSTMSCSKNNLMDYASVIERGDMLAANLFKQIDGLSANEKFAYAVKFYESNDKKLPAQQRGAATLSLIKLAADQGSPTAMNELGYSLISCSFGVQQDISYGVELIKMAAKQADRLAIYNLGRMYMAGLGVEQSPILGLAHFQQCLALGYDECGVEIEKYNFMKNNALEIAKYKSSDG